MWRRGGEGRPEGRRARSPRARRPSAEHLSDAEIAVGGTAAARWEVLRANLEAVMGYVDGSEFRAASGNKVPAWTPPVPAHRTPAW